MKHSLRFIGVYFRNVRINLTLILHRIYTIVNTHWKIYPPKYFQKAEGTAQQTKHEEIKHTRTQETKVTEKYNTMFTSKHVNIVHNKQHTTENARLCYRASVW